jgi:hypothetical protein
MGRSICLGLPETTEKLAWGEPTWRIAQAYREVAPPRLREAAAATRSRRR